MRISRWHIKVGAGLIGLSALLYFVHFLIFRDAHHIYLYLVGDIAFLPIEVLLVTVVIEGLLGAREKRAMLQKMNMVIGAYFSEVGTELLRRCVAADEGIDGLRPKLLGMLRWHDDDFAAAKAAVSLHRGHMTIPAGELPELRDFLAGKQDFMLRLLENPNLLEHDGFTDLLWATFHLTEELESRQRLTETAGPDLEHIHGDMARAYGLIIIEWLDYMIHLKKNYPYLYSLSARLNPFDPNASPEIA